MTLSIDDAKALGTERKGITLKSYDLSFVLAECVTATAQATTKSEICGWLLRGAPNGRKARNE